MSLLIAGFLPRDDWKRSTGPSRKVLTRFRNQSCGRIEPLETVEAAKFQRIELQRPRGNRERTAGPSAALPRHAGAGGMTKGGAVTFIKRRLDRMDRKEIAGPPTPLRFVRDDHSDAGVASIFVRRMTAGGPTELSSRPERTRISYIAVPHEVTYAAFRRESRMKFANATSLDRKSAGA